MGGLFGKEENVGGLILFFNQSGFSGIRQIVDFMKKGQKRPWKNKFINKIIDFQFYESCFLLLFIGHKYLT